jgi:pimeloyl-ACP methyl ester carboxylesterase
MSNFVLIPGAGTGPDQWVLVEPLLRVAGHETVAVDLPNEDDAAGLPEYTAVALDAIGDRTELIVVGQSLGAFTAAAVAAEHGADLLVFLNGMIPAEGETPGEWGENVGHAEAAADVFAKYGPPSSWGEEALQHVFLHDIPPENLVLAPPRQQGGGVFGTPLTKYPADIPARAIGGDIDRFFPIEFQQRIARERLGVELDVVPGGHVLPLANPEALASQLLAYA